MIYHAKHLVTGEGSHGIVQIAVDEIDALNEAVIVSVLVREGASESLTVRYCEERGSTTRRIRPTAPVRLALEWVVEDVLAGQTPLQAINLYFPVAESVEDL